MSTATLTDALGERPYPGRGCVVARTADATLSFVYFLTGRSSASRARTLEVASEGALDVIDTRDDGEVDALRHYRAIAARDEWVVAGNGDHVEPIAVALAAGEDALTASSVRTFEPDPPIFTSRIWVAAKTGESRADCLVGYIRRRDDGGADRVVGAIDDLGAGHGVMMTTYDGSVSEVRATRSHEEVVVTAATSQDLLHGVWEALDPRLRVGAAVVSPGCLGSGVHICTGDRGPRP